MQTTTVKTILQTALSEMLLNAISPANAWLAASPMDLTMIPTPKMIPPIRPNMIVPASATFIHPMYRNLKSM